MSDAMRFQRRGGAGAEIPVVVDGERAYDLRSLTPDLDGAFLAGGGLDRARAAVRAGELAEVDVDGLRYGAPVARPAAVVCIGQNYAAHAAETGDPPPANPILFFKHPNTVVGPYDDVLRPPGAEKLDWEVELAVVIGATARYLPDRTAALRCVAGYAVSNDVSERHYQAGISGGQWSKGKTAETFNPLGPSLVAADDVPDPQALRLRSWVNGEPRQDSTTADMVFDVAALILDLSRFMVLEPGDVVNTGTPQGVALSGRFPYLRDGDEIRLWIDGLGEQRQTIRPADA